MSRCGQCHELICNSCSTLRHLELDAMGMSTQAKVHSIQSILDMLLAQLVCSLSSQMCSEPLLSRTCLKPPLGALYVTLLGITAAGNAYLLVGHWRPSQASSSFAVRGPLTGAGGRECRTNPPGAWDVCIVPSELALHASARLLDSTLIAHSGPHLLACIRHTRSRSASMPSTSQHCAPLRGRLKAEVKHIS